MRSARPWSTLRHRCRARTRWRRTSGVHRISDRRSLAIVRELWTARDSMARRRDVAPHRVLPDSAIIAAAAARPPASPPWWRCRCSRAGCSAATPTCGSPRSPVPWPCRSTTCRRPGSPATGRPPRPSGHPGTRSRRLDCNRPGPAWPNCRTGCTSRWRICSHPTWSAGCSGRHRTTRAPGCPRALSPGLAARGARDGDPALAPVRAAIKDAPQPDPLTDRRQDAAH